MGCNIGKLGEVVVGEKQILGTFRNALLEVGVELPDSVFGQLPLGFHLFAFADIANGTADEKTFFILYRADTDGGGKGGPIGTHGKEFLIVNGDPQQDRKSTRLNSSH